MRDFPLANQKGEKSSYFNSTAMIFPVKLHLELHFFPDHFNKWKPNREQMQYKSNTGRKKLKILCSPCRFTTINLLALFSFLLSFSFFLFVCFVLFCFCIPSQISSSLKQPLIKLPKGLRLHAAISPLLSAQMFQAHSITPTCHYS